MLTKFQIFIVSGGIAACVNIASRIALEMFISFESAVFLAYLMGMLTAYLLSKAWVFDLGVQLESKSFIKFSIVNLGSLLIVWIVSTTLYYIIFPVIAFDFYPKLVAHSLGVVSPVYFSYFLHRHFSFN